MSAKDRPESDVPHPERQSARPEWLEQLAANVGVDLDNPPPAEEGGEPYVEHARIRESKCEGMLRIVDREGPTWLVKCDVCGEEWGIPMLRFDPAMLRAHRMKHSGIPDRFAGQPFDTGDSDQQPVVAACREWLRGFRSAPLPAPAIYGKAGRGKSHLLCMLVEALITAYGTHAIYRSAVQMFDELQAGFDSKSNRYEDVWRRLTSCAVLALDDLGAERLTEWRQDRLMALVDARYSAKLPLLIVTNLAPSEWEDAWGERAASRLKGNTTALMLRGPDRRYQGEQSRLIAGAAA